MQRRDEDKAMEYVTALLLHIGEDPNRAGLKDTPKRVLKSFDTLYGGYAVDPASLFTVFDEPCDEMVILREIEFSSMCEHHMLPFVGHATIGYIPNGKVVGISKLARLLECFARRLQIQERICQQVTAALMEHLQPLGAACVLEAQHMCMTCRGVNKQHSSMVTSSLTGVLRTDPAARAEFLSFCH